jgi:iron complex outermembrane receptor protein
MIAIASTLVLANSPAFAQEVRGPESPVQTSNAPSLASTASLDAPGQGAAAPASPQGLDEIVVTARKVAENLQDVPVSVTAFSGEALQQQNARQVADVARLTPGLVIREATSSGAAATFQIRGQFQNDVLATLDPSVGVYVDGYYWSRAYGINSDLLDVQSVQTLRGPQGTLFGRNTTGGAILIQTNDPNFNGMSGLVSGTYGRFDYKSGTGVLNLPIVDDRIALRLAYSRSDSDGFVRNTASGQRLGERDAWTARGKLLIQATDNLSLLFSAEQYKTSYRNNPYRLQYVSPSAAANLEAGLEAGGLGCLVGGAATIGACLVNGIALNNAAIAVANDNDRFGQNARNDVFAKTQTYTGTATLDTFFGAVKFIGGYRKVRSRASVDLDGSPADLLSTAGFQNIHQYSGEVQFTGKALNDSLDFAAGVFYFTESGSDNSFSAGLPAVQSSPIASNTIPAFLNYLETGNSPIQYFAGRIKSRSQGIYGQATYHITDALGFTGGLRYSVEDKGLTSNNGAYTAGTYLGPQAGAVFICNLPGATCPSSREDDFNGISYTAGIEYQITNDLLVYAKTAKGFRSGGQNLRSTGAVLTDTVTAASFAPFKPEKATSYEGGVKSEFLDRRVRLNIAGYYTKVDDIQRSSLTSVGGNQTTVLGNAGRADIYGGEAEVDALLFEGFRIGGSVAYTRPKYKSYIDPVTGFDRRREPFDNVPRWTFSVSPSYSHDFGFGKLLVRGDYNYQSKTYLYNFGYYTDSAGVTHDASTGNVLDLADAQGLKRGITMKAVGLVNARASLTVHDGAFEIAVFGRNLTDNRGKIVALPVIGLGEVAAIRREPRTWGVTGTFKFGS